MPFWWTLLTGAAMLGLALVCPGQPPPEKFKPQGEDKVFEKFVYETDKAFEQLDENGDRFLNEDEMPLPLKQELGRWDVNRDGLIDVQEYRNYLHARLRLSLDGKLDVTPDVFVKEKKPKERDKGNAGGEVRVGGVEDIDSRPLVFRAGKLPRELPEWFERLDTDKDGQVGLYEWRRANFPPKEFQPLDRNKDGFLTAEEVLFHARMDPGATITGLEGRPLALVSTEKDKGKSDKGKKPRQ